MARRLLDIVALEQELEELNRFISHKEEQPLVHKIHVYPARFLPQIPRAFVTHLTSPGELVLDPMVGLSLIHI